MTDTSIPDDSRRETERGSPPAAPQAGTVIDADLRAWNRHLRLLVGVNSVLAGAFSPEMVYEQILLCLKEIADFDRASIYRFDREDGTLHRVAETGGGSSLSSPTLPLDASDAVAGAARTSDAVAGAARTMEAVYVSGIRRDAHAPSGDPMTRAEYAVPLLSGARLLGVLVVESGPPDGIRAATRKLVDQIASQVALALERGELHRNLQESENRFRSIFEQGQVGIGVANQDGKVVAANPALARFLGCEPGELLNRHIVELIPPAERPEALQGVQRVLDGLQPPFTADWRFLRKSGETVWGMTTISLIRDFAGQPSHILVMVQDVSTRKHAEEERARLQEQLLQAQKMNAVGTLAGGIAHDFNNLLGVIAGCTSLLQLRLPGQDPRQNLAAMVQQAAERAAGLTRQLLQFSRQEPLQLQPVDIGEVLRAVVEIVSQTFDRRIRVEADLPPHLPLVESDAGQLETALLNLCINARDAMPEGGTLSLKAAVVNLTPMEFPPGTEGAPGQYVRIVVRDTGVGMEPQVIERIFEPFFTTKTSGQGTGLGLAMVYGTVMNHQGFIAVRSQVGQGSEFTLHLPVSMRPAEIPRPQALPIEPGSGTVLVVDDEPLMQAFTCDAVRQLGYEALAAANGSEACEIFARESAKIDAVLLDMVMPGLSWTATLQSLLAINPRVRIIMISGYNAAREARRAREQGAMAFLGKPYTVEGLAQVLKDATR
jgi:PAS domain S-box-containing protein